MLWIRVASDLPDSPKLGKLARVLRINRDAAIARVVGLWGWAARHAPDGNLSGIPSEEIAQGAKWRGHPGRFLAGLKSVSFIDRDGFIHEWERFNGALLRDAKRKRDKRFTERIKALESADKSKDAGADAVGPTLRNVTRPVNKEQPPVAPLPATPRAAPSPAPLPGVAFSDLPKDAQRIALRYLGGKNLQMSVASANVSEKLRVQEPTRVVAWLFRLEEAMKAKEIDEVLAWWRGQGDKAGPPEWALEKAKALMNPRQERKGGDAPESAAEIVAKMGASHA